MPFYANFRPCFDIQPPLHSLCTAGVGTRVSTSTPPLAVKDTLALTASAQEVPSAPTDTDARPDDSAGEAP
jgi:hypothetical protein